MPRSTNCDAFYAAHQHWIQLIALDPPRQIAINLNSNLPKKNLKNWKTLASSTCILCRSWSVVFWYFMPAKLVQVQQLGRGALWVSEMLQFQFHLSFLLPQRLRRLSLEVVKRPYFSGTGCSRRRDHACWASEKGYWCRCRDHQQFCAFQSLPLSTTDSAVLELPVIV